MKSRTGKIITFYSYKGGTGRTMALANIGCLLAREENRKVLVIDWDLEAPGLHRYFQKNRYLENPLQKNEREDVFNGVIDLFIDLNHQLNDRNDWDSDEFAEDLFRAIGLSKYIQRTSVPNLCIMYAGKFDEYYSTKVNTFNWEELFEKALWIIPSFAYFISREFDYVLVDSRTGLNDASGICTTLLPEKLVAVFTPNKQSVIGLVDLIKDATEYRKQSDDLRPLVVFPLPSRIEAEAPDLGIKQLNQ